MTDDDLIAQLRVGPEYVYRFVDTDHAAADRIEALLAEIAALRAERDELQDQVDALNDLVNMNNRTAKTLEARAEAAEARAAALTAQVERLTGAVWLKVGECLAGMTHAEVSPAARRMIEKAIRAALSATEEGHE